MHGEITSRFCGKLTMRKLKLLVQISIDGYIARTDGRTDWMIWNWGNDWEWDDKLQKDFTDITNSIDCILLSRQMAEEGFVAHWEKTAQDRNNSQYTFAKKISDTKKIVFTKTIHQSRWNNTYIAKKDFVGEINDLKKQEGNDIIVYGGATFASSLIKAGLIDEYYLFVNPTALGSGLSIFKEQTNLTLIDAASYGCGITVLKYIPSTNVPNSR